MTKGNAMNALGSKTIRNCHFRYRCHMEWDDLDATGSDTVRHCAVCDKDVHWCPTQESLARAVLANLCAAIPADVVDRHGYDKVSPGANLHDPGTLLGDVAGFD